MATNFPLGLFCTTFYDSQNDDKGVVFNTSTLSTGNFATLAFTGSAARAYTFPNASDTITLNSTASTLTNKTLTNNNNVVYAERLWVNAKAATVSTSAAAVPSANQVLKTSSSSVASFVTQNLSATLVDGNTAGANSILMNGTGGITFSSSGNLTMDGVSDIILSTSGNTITTLNGQALTIQASDGVGGAAGGTVNISAGTGNTNGDGGDINITAGKLAGTGRTGDVVISCNTGALVGSIRLTSKLYIKASGTPTTASPGVTINAGSSDSIGSITVNASTSGTITFGDPYPAGVRVRIFTQLTAFVGANTNFQAIYITADNNSSWSFRSDYIATVTFSYFAVAFTG